MKTIMICLFICCTSPIFSQDINAILQKARAKTETVNDYEATGRMRTNVAFLKVPVANIKVYFKRPDRLKVKSEKGISFIPKGAVNLNMNSILGTGKFTVLDAGTDKLKGETVRVARLLPEEEASEIVLSTLYIDEANSLVRKVRTTTRDNGTYELEMSYGKYANYGLPDKIIFSFNTKEYKLPKGVTFDFELNAPAPKDKTKNKKGRAEITFNNYIINKGVSDAVFK
ncbi:MAG: hypothetical protein WKF88_02050 [Ferruginibacter sp.]